MPKRRQIPRMFSATLAAGVTVWHWKPDAKLRAAGWTNVKLGSDETAAVVRALELNAQVKAWQDAGQVAVSEGGVPARSAPRIVRFDELLTRYRASDAFTTLAKSTRADYNVRLRQLEHWAMDGTIAVRDIDQGMVRDLRNALVQNHSPHRAASELRVLRLLLQWAVKEGIVAHNPATHSDIPEPPARATLSTDAERLAIQSAARRLGLADVDFGIDLALWLIQRQGDLLALNRMAWRELHNVEPRHAAVLASPKGRVMAFRLRQAKTGAWVDAPVPPSLHDAVEARLDGNKGGWLFEHPDGLGDRAMSGFLFQRRYRHAREAALEEATAAGDETLAAALAGNQFRDLRRTGMTRYSNAGAKLAWITALSGHAVLGRRTILDTYMPGNTDAACACVATGVMAELERAKRELLA